MKAFFDERNYNSANIILLGELKFDLSNTESLQYSNFLTWSGVRYSVPSHLRIRSREINKDHVRSLQFKIGDRSFDSTLSTVCLHLVRLQSPEASQS